MSEQLDRLGRQLEAIELAIAAARAEPNLAKRNHILEVVARASTAARLEYLEATEDDKKRPVLRLIKGGAVAAAATTGAEWVRHAWRSHPQAAGASALVAAAAVTAAVYLGIEATNHTTPTAAPPAAVLPAPNATTRPQLPTAPATFPPAAPSTSPSTSPSISTPTTGSPSTSPQASTPAQTSSSPPTGGATSPTGAPPTASPTPTGTHTSPAGPPPESPGDGTCLALRLRPVLDTGSCQNVAGAR